MGGIFCAVAPDNIIPNIMQGLASLECVGYDSAGLGAVSDHQIRRRRARGPLSVLESLLANEPIVASTAIAHKRAATQGKPSRHNAHPLASARVALVQDGTIENHAELRAELERDGVQFRSETDAEAVVWLLDRELANRAHPLVALQRVIPRLQGSFALSLICAQYEEHIFAVSHGRPLCIGKSHRTAWLASNAASLGSFADETVALADGQIAELRPGQVCVFDSQLRRLAPRWARVQRRRARAETGKFYANAAYGEIQGQPAMLARSLAELRRDLSSGSLESWCGPLSHARRILAIGCGPSYHVAHIARTWLEQIAGIPTGLGRCSELETLKATLTEETTALVVSKTQGDAETLGAVRYLKELGISTIALVDGMTSAIAEEADAALDCRRGQGAGSERGIAFTSQLCALAAASIGLRQLRREQSELEGPLASVFDVPQAMETALALEDQCTEVALRIAKAGYCIYAGRGTSYPLARVAALELETRSNVQAEGLAGGELRHRLPARIAPDAPLIVIAPGDATFDTSLLDAREIIARGGEPVLVGDRYTAKAAKREGLRCIAVGDVDPIWSPIVLAIPLQLIAHHAARASGREESLQSGRPGATGRLGRT